MLPDSHTLEQIITELRQREERGVGKYGTTVDRVDLKLADWLRHLHEELLDAVVYSTRCLADLQPQKPATWTRIEDFRSTPGTVVLAWWWDQASVEEGVVLDDALLDHEGRIYAKGACGADFYTHVMPAGFERPAPPKVEC